MVFCVTQKYCCNSNSRWQVKSIRDENPAYCCGYWCCQWRYHQLYPSNYCHQFSNVGDYPIAVTLGANPNYSVVSTNGILSVTPKSIAVTVIADGKSKVYGMKILRLLLWLLVLPQWRYHQLYPSNYCHSILMLGTILLL
jgi:hypothetical protein